MNPEHLNLKELEKAVGMQPFDLYHYSHDGLTYRQALEEEYKKKFPDNNPVKTNA